MMLRTRAWTMILTSQLHQSNQGAALVIDTHHLTSAPRFCHRQMMTLLQMILARLVHPGLLCNLSQHKTEAEQGWTSLLHHIDHLHRSHALHRDYLWTTTTEADLVTTTTSHWNNNHNKTNHFNLNNSTSTTRNNLLHNHMMTNHLATTPWTMATQSTMATMWKQRKITTKNFSTTSTLLLFLQLQLQFNNANFNDYNHLQLTTLQLQSTMCTTPSNGILR